MEDKYYSKYIRVLEEELLPAMGCTEPIAVAYAGALARKTLGEIPEKILLEVSGNIIKNVKSVIVPNTGGRKGLETAVLAGACLGDSDKELEVIADVTEEQTDELQAFIDSIEVEVKGLEDDSTFDIHVTVYSEKNKAFVRIYGKHTNVVSIKKNSKKILEVPIQEEVATQSDREWMSVKGIYEFATSVDIETVRPMLERQIIYNMSIAEEGLTRDYGARIGKILLSAYGDNVQNKAKAWAAAGSDARMNGSELPVIINSGSGNQGITASVPVIIYAKEQGADEETLLRALIISNLVTIHLKTGIGRLSAYCGATSAGAGAGAGVCFLRGGKLEEIESTIVNALAINSGVICDGAKASCAAKIASSVEAGLLGMQMYENKSKFSGGDGIVLNGVENTIKAVGSLARDGMKCTDKKIIEIMLSNSSK